MLKAGECAENETKIKFDTDKNVNDFTQNKREISSLIIAVHYCPRNFSQSQKSKFDAKQLGLVPL